MTGRKMNIFSICLLVMTVAGPRPYVPPHVLAIDTPARPTSLDVEVTADTEIRLDGRPCRLEDVPENAEVTLLEVGKDGRTATRIHFRSVTKLKKIR